MKYLDPNTDKMMNQKIVTSNFDRAGNPPIGSKEMVYAQTKEYSASIGFYIATYDGAPFNPSGMFSDREKYIDIKMKKVSKETFDFYMLFLKTNNSLYLTRAQRSFLND